MNRFRVIGIWILQFLIAALFVIQGIVKLSGSPAWVSKFHKWGYPEHFYLVVGIVELVAAIAMLIPRLAKWGALALITVMTGATATHAVHREPQVITTLVLLTLLATIMYLRRCLRLRKGNRPSQVPL